MGMPCCACVCERVHACVRVSVHVVAIVTLWMHVYGTTVSARCQISVMCNVSYPLLLCCPFVCIIRVSFGMCVCTFNAEQSSFWRHCTYPRMPSFCEFSRRSEHSQYTQTLHREYLQVCIYLCVVVCMNELRSGKRGSVGKRIFRICIFHHTYTTQMCQFWYNLWTTVSGLTCQFSSKSASCSSYPFPQHFFR